MKDSYMVFVLFAVLITPFLPQLLKAKCPSSNKRKLDSVESPASADKAADEQRFVTYFKCKACDADFSREKSGPLVKIQ